MLMYTVLMTKSRSGFTIVELLIVIVVIAILATISLVAYRGIQKRAAETALQSDLRQAATFLEDHSITNGSYPTTTDAIPGSAGTSYQITASSGDTYCLTATTPTAGASPYHISKTGGVVAGPCQGHTYGGPAPAGVNIAAPLDQWTLSGGATYNAVTKEITLTSAGSVATSPYIRVDSPQSFVMSVEMNSPVKDAGPNGQRAFGSSYFDENYDSYTLSNGYSGNGSAASVAPPNTWTTSNWTVNATGPNFMYLRFRVFVDSNYGVVGTRIRNPSVTVNR